MIFLLCTFLYFSNNYTPQNNHSCYFGMFPNSFQKYFKTSLESCCVLNFPSLLNHLTAFSGHLPVSLMAIWYFFTRGATIFFIALSWTVCLVYFSQCNSVMNSNVPKILFPRLNTPLKSILEVQTQGQKV